MDTRLKGKRAFVTGSSRGIGEGIATTLANEGAKVVVHGREKSGANRVAEKIKSGGRESAVAIGDLSTDDSAQEVARQAASVFGGIDILVNNAGGGDPAVLWMDASTEEWSEAFNANVLGAVRMIHYFASGMRERGWGRIVQISSVVSLRPPSVGPEYSAAKAALNNLSMGLAKELAHSGVTINTVSPGPILTPQLESSVRQFAEQNGWGEDWDEIEKRAVFETMPNPAGRFGRIQEVADLVTFLASPLAGYINGANLLMDGGYAVTAN